MKREAVFEELKSNKGLIFRQAEAGFKLYKDIVLISSDVFHFNMFGTKFSFLVISVTLEFPLLECLFELTVSFGGS